MIDEIRVQGTMERSAGRRGEGGYLIKVETGDRPHHCPTVLACRMSRFCILCFSVGESQGREDSKDSDARLETDGKKGKGNQGEDVDEDEVISRQNR